MAGHSSTQRARNSGKEPPLTQRLELFCRYYVNPEYTARAAYLKAGFASSGNVNTLDRRINLKLADSRVIRRIAELEQKKYTQLEITAERIEAEYAAIAFGKISDVVDWGEMEIPVGKDKNGNDVTRKVFYINPIPAADLEDDKVATIKEISQTQHGVSIKMYDKLSALGMLARRFDRFHERLKKIDEDDNKPVPKLTDADLSKIKDMFDADF